MIIRKNVVVLLENFNMRKPICSNKTFERMIKSFKKYANKQIQRNPHINVYPIIKYFFNGGYNIGFDELSNNLFKRFKGNPYKTKSGYKSEKCNDFTFWVSYTIQDETGKRYYGKDLKNKIIAFKVHMQIGNHRKKRIACWKVQLQEKSIKT